MSKRKLTKEEENHAQLINGLIQSYGLDRLMKQQNRPVRRLWAKYFWFPLYAVGNPVITIVLYYYGHWFFGTIVLLYTIYGFLKMFLGDRAILFILKPFLKIIYKRIYK